MMVKSVASVYKTELELNWNKLFEQKDPKQKIKTLQKISRIGNRLLSCATTEEQVTVGVNSVKIAEDMLFSLMLQDKGLKDYSLIKKTFEASHLLEVPAQTFKSKVQKLVLDTKNKLSKVAKTTAQILNRFLNALSNYSQISVPPKGKGIEKSRRQAKQFCKEVIHFNKQSPDAQRLEIWQAAVKAEPKILEYVNNIATISQMSPDAIAAQVMLGISLDGPFLSPKARVLKLVQELSNEMKQQVARQRQAKKVKAQTQELEKLVKNKGGTIKPVTGDGNCGLYALLRGGLAPASKWDKMTPRDRMKWAGAMRKDIANEMRKAGRETRADAYENNGSGRVWTELNELCFTTNVMQKPLAVFMADRYLGVNYFIILPDGMKKSEVKAKDLCAIKFNINHYEGVEMGLKAKENLLKEAKAEQRFRSIEETLASE